MLYVFAFKTMKTLLLFLSTFVFFLSILDSRIIGFYSKISASSLSKDISDFWVHSNFLLSRFRAPADVSFLPLCRGLNWIYLKPQARRGITMDCSGFTSISYCMAWPRRAYSLLLIPCFETSSSVISEIEAWLDFWLTRPYAPWLERIISRGIWRLLQICIGDLMIRCFFPSACCVWQIT